MDRRDKMVPVSAQASVWMREAEIIYFVRDGEKLTMKGENGPRTSRPNLWHTIQKHFVPSNVQLASLPDVYWAEMDTPVDILYTTIEDADVRLIVISNNGTSVDTVFDLTEQAASRLFWYPMKRGGTFYKVDVSLSTSLLAIKLNEAETQASKIRGRVATFFPEQPRSGVLKSDTHFFLKVDNGGGSGVFFCCDDWSPVGSKPYRRALAMEDRFPDGEERPLLPEWDSWWHKPYYRDGTAYAHLSTAAASRSFGEAGLVNDLMTVHVFCDAKNVRHQLHGDRRDCFNSYMRGEMTPSQLDTMIPVEEFLRDVSGKKPHARRSGADFFLVVP